MNFTNNIIPTIRSNQVKKYIKNKDKYIYLTDSQAGNISYYRTHEIMHKTY
jgi:hypothetical protein